MNKVVRIDGKYDLKSINNDELSKIIEIFNNNIDCARKILSNEMTKSNLNYLLANYIEMINKLSTLGNENDNLNVLSKNLYTLVEQINSNATIIDCILVFFNIFRICGFDINILSLEEIGALINIYYVFENEVDFSKTDCFAKFIFEENLIHEARSYNYNDRELCMLYVDAASNCIDDNIFSVYQMKKYVKEALERYKYVDEEKSYNNINELYDYVYEQVSIFSQMLFTTENEKNIKTANKWLWNLDILKTKINNASDEEKNVYFKEISNIFLEEPNKDLPLAKKINMLFDFVFPDKKIVEFKTINSK